MKKMKITSRILAILLCAVLTVLCVATLTSCGKNPETGYNMTDSEKADYADASSREASVRKYVARIVKLDATRHEQFVAAYRGYDLIDGNVDPAADAPQKATDLTAAGKVLDAVAEKVTDDTSKTVLADFKAALTADDVTTVVERMKSTVELEAKNGVVATILLWIGKFLNWMTGLTGGFYAISIFLFAFIMKIIFFPASIKQQKTQIAQAKLRPKIAQIEKKYAGRNDQATRQKMQQEIMDLQQREGAGCLSGCLPLLIQFPIIIALYNIITNPLHYVLGIADTVSNALSTYVTASKAAGGLGITLTNAKSTISVLSQIGNVSAAEGIKDFAYFSNSADIWNTIKDIVIPNFSLFGLNLGDVPSLKAISLLVIIPVIATVFQWLTMFLTKKWNGNTGASAGDAQTAASMKMMDLMFPAMTLFISFSLPAMLGLYWIYQSVLGLGQTFLLSRLMPMPSYTAEELREMEKAAKEKEKAARAAAQAQPRHKSLHYIDEDDYDVLPEIKNDGKKDEKKGPLGLDAGSLKDDKK